MALDVEGIIGCCVHGEKSLCGSRALKPLHLAFSSSGWLMRVLGSIVAPSAAFMAIRNPKMTFCSPVRTQVVCDELIRHEGIFLQ